MTASAHRETLAELTALYSAFREANWHPAEQPPLAAVRWFSITPILLSHYRSIIEELEALEALDHGRE